MVSVCACMYCMCLNGGSDAVTSVHAVGIYMCECSGGEGSSLEKGRLVSRLALPRT